MCPLASQGSCFFCCSGSLSNCTVLCYAKLLIHVRLFVTPWTVIRQALLSMDFSKEEYWSGLPCPPPGDLPNPGMGPRSTALQADSLPSEPPRNLIAMPD